MSLFTKLNFCQSVFLPKSANLMSVKCTTHMVISSLTYVFEAEIFVELLLNWFRYLDIWMTENDDDDEFFDKLYTEIFP